MNNFKTLNKTSIAHKKNGNRIGKFLASTLSIILSFNATTLATAKTNTNTQSEKQEVSSNIKKDSKKDIKKHSAKNLGKGFAIGGAVCLGIERLVTGRWIPKTRLCMSHFTGASNALVISKDENARRKFSRLMFGSEQAPEYYHSTHLYRGLNGKPLGTVNMDFSIQPTDEETKSIKIPQYIRSGFIDGSHTSSVFKVILAVVDADKETEQVKRDIRDMVDYICDYKRGRTQLIVVGCTDRTDVTWEDRKMNGLSGHVSGIEFECTEGRCYGTKHNLDLGHNGYKQFLCFYSLNAGQERSSAVGLKNLIAERAH